MKELLNNPNVGLLLIRLVLGGMFMAFGIPKLKAGSAMWEGIGSAMGHFGLTKFYIFFGLMAALTEAVGGLLIIIGFKFRVATILLAFTMLVASVHLYLSGQEFGMYSRPIELMAVFVGLTLIGAGKYSVDRR